MTTHNGRLSPTRTPHLPPPDEADSTAPHLPALLSLGLMVGTINGLSRVALPLYAVAAHAQPWQVGIVGGLGYLGVLLMALPMGAWIDRHGTRCFCAALPPPRCCTCCCRCCTRLGT
jgi:MFS family permease